MKMLNEFLSIAADLLARYWAFALAACVLALLAALWLFSRFFGGRTDADEGEKKRVSSNQARLNRSAPLSLSRLSSEHYSISNDVFVPRLDGHGNTRLHHIVLSKFGIFVVQVQPENGIISGTLEDREWTLVQADGRKHFINPITRSTYHVKALAKFLDVSEEVVFPVILFDAEPRIEAPCPPYMITGGLGRYIVTHQKIVLSQEELDDIALKFTCLTSHRDPDAAVQKHKALRVRRLRHSNERVA